MKASFVALALSLFSLASAAPVVEKRQAINDAVILNYALTLEHLEATFYAQALAKYNTKAFTDAGYDASVRSRITEIAGHEKTHVDFLTAGLTAAGATPVAACTYNFGYTDVKTFLATASILEGVGVSAYLGAAASIMSKDYLTAAATILTVESRHSAFIRDTTGASPFPSAFDVPLGFNQVYSLAAPFFVSCPDSNPALPVKAFPALAGSSSKPVPGGMAKFTPADKSILSKPGPLTIAWIGFPANAYGAYNTKTQMVEIPKSGFCGQSYAVLISGDGKSGVTDDNTLAGPAVIDIQC